MQPDAPQGGRRCTGSRYRAWTQLFNSVVRVLCDAIEVIVIGQEFAAQLMSTRENDGVREAQALMIGARFGGAFGRGRRERRDSDAHGGDRVAGIADPVNTSESYERLAIGARGGDQRNAGSVGGFDGVDGTSVMGVGAVQKSD
jgi:hypothetical protein